MPTSAPFWVSVLRINDVVAGKLGSKHGLRPDDVRQAVECRRGLRATADVDPERGLRFLLTMTIQRRRVILVLRPVSNDVDVYRLVSAYPA